MVKFILCFISLMFLAHPAHSVLWPSDSSSGGGDDNIYWFMHFGSNASAWPATTTCLSSQNGGSQHRTLCDDTDDPESRLGKNYFGQVFVRYLSCTPTGLHALWLSGSLQLAVHEFSGSDAGSDYVRNQLGGTLTFDETDTVGVSQRLTINAHTTLENGNLQIKFTAVSAAPAAPANGFTCVVALTE